ncbi:MAG TPA: hypothetical protein VIX35_03515 [Vicinamibacterales bacterium]
MLRPTWHAMSTTFDPFESLSPAGAVRRKRTFLLAVLAVAFAIQCVLAAAFVLWFASMDWFSRLYLGAVLAAGLGVIGRMVWKTAHQAEFFPFDKRRRLHISLVIPVAIIDVYLVLTRGHFRHETLLLDLLLVNGALVLIIRSFIDEPKPEVKVVAPKWRLRLLLAILAAVIALPFLPLLFRWVFHSR